MTSNRPNNGACGEKYFRYAQGYKGTLPEWHLLKPELSTYVGAR